VESVRDEIARVTGVTIEDIHVYEQLDEAASQVLLTKLIMEHSRPFLRFIQDAFGEIKTKEVIEKDRELRSFYNFIPQSMVVGLWRGSRWLSEKLSADFLPSATLNTHPVGLALAVLAFVAPQFTILGIGGVALMFASRKPLARFAQRLSNPSGVLYAWSLRKSYKKAMENFTQTGE
jgi:hypothetical protein